MLNRAGTRQRKPSCQWAWRSASRTPSGFAPSTEIESSSFILSSVRPAVARSHRADPAHMQTESACLHMTSTMLHRLPPLRTLMLAALCALPLAHANAQSLRDPAWETLLEN